jgi:hypothetical protein
MVKIRKHPCEPHGDLDLLLAIRRAESADVGIFPIFLTSNVAFSSSFSAPQAGSIRLGPYLFKCNPVSIRYPLRCNLISLGLSAVLLRDAIQYHACRGTTVKLRHTRGCNSFQREK